MDLLLGAGLYSHTIMGNGLIIRGFGVGRGPIR